MPGVTDLVNVSLRLIGQTTITDITDGSSTANIVDDLYTEIRDDLLRQHSWNFATKRVELARSSTAPAFEFDYAYVLPADWIRTISVHDNDAGHGTVLYRSEFIDGQRCLITSSDQMYLRYVYQVTDPNLMAADFRRALELAIASDLAVPIASSNKLKETLYSQFQQAMARARSADAMGAFPELRPRGSWASARSGWRGNNDFLSD